MQGMRFGQVLRDAAANLVTALGSRMQKGSRISTDQIRGVCNDDVEGVGESIGQLSRMVVVVECEV